MSTEMPKTYQPQQFEREMYANWEKKGYFEAHQAAGKKPFTIVMPPPNITGQLHMGHAMYTVQDVLTRYHRMKGDPTLWLPGTDHAAIATEARIVAAMAQEGITKQDIGREAFLGRAWAWREKYGGRIAEQLRLLGASCDWSRERFTMDEGLSKAVVEVFVRLYEKGLIYRGEKIINWCPECRTTLSDIEVEYEEQHSQLWHIRYPGEDGSQGVIVATTRPETMLGDTGVAVHPEDSRYDGLRGKNVILPILNRIIPVVFDEYVDQEFGTGAVKMTPAHDPNDFEVAQRHSLPLIRVMKDDGSMNENAGPYAGMKALECRKLVVEKLKNLGLLVKIEPYAHNVGTCYRCHHTVEPLASRQWFVKMKPLAEPAIEAVKSGETQFVPPRFEKTYLNWMENIRDWCISRQLWWGHRIPAYYCDACGEMTVSKEMPKACPKCGKPMRQDEDVLDTWFSSALWPFSTLGWPDDTEDLRYFYPTSTLVTAYDIIFFWVARMIFSGIEQMGQSPFDTVLIHGLVRDAQGRKMSKSLDNGVDPQEVIEKYGADALRFALIFGVAPGNDINFSTDKVEAARNFANKVYNASRFVLMNIEEDVPLTDAQPELSDKWILAQLNGCIRDVTAHLDENDLGLASQRVYDFAWSAFCDWYIEWAKPRLMDGELAQKRTAQAVLLHCLKGLLRLLHPIMPFLTESIWQALPGAAETIMLAEWPFPDAALDFPAEASACEGIMEAIRAVRGLRAEMKVEPSRRVRLLMLPAEPFWADTIQASQQAFQRLCGASSVEVLEGFGSLSEKTVSLVCPAAEIRIPMGDLVDLQKEQQRLEKEKTGIENEIRRAESMLSNEGYLAKAPEDLIQATREKLEESRRMLVSIARRIKEMAEG